MEATGTLLFFFLMLALLLVSWLMGYYARARERLRPRLPPDPDYFVGLNYLLNDEPDDAIDVFIAALEVNAATFDTHLALGKLLRRRGKVDRAIEHYCRLLTTAGFNARQMAELRIQLLRSYIAAGLLDRAEQLLLEVQQTASIRREALHLAVMLYQIEKEWRPALYAAAELLPLEPAQHRHDLLLQMSHFHCELAEDALQRNEHGAARAELRQALQLFKGNARVYLLLAQIEQRESAHHEAVPLLHKALQADPALFAEIAPLLRSAAQAAGQDPSQWLPLELEPELGADPAFRSAVAQQRGQLHGASDMVRAFLDGLRQAPSLQLLQQTLRAAAQEKVMQDAVVEAGAAVLKLHLQALPRFRCEHCGFELRNLHWACPGCSCWGMVKPIDTLITHGPECAQVHEPRVQP